MPFFFQDAEAEVGIYYQMAEMETEVISRLEPLLASPSVSSIHLGPHSRPVEPEAWGCSEALELEL